MTTFAPVRRQTVHHKRVFFRVLQKVLIDLHTFEVLEFFLPHRLFAHTHPHVGIKHVRTLDRHARIPANSNAAAIALS